MKNGFVNVISRHTTTAVTINEYEVKGVNMFIVFVYSVPVCVAVCWCVRAEVQVEHIGLLKNAC